MQHKISLTRTNNIRALLRSNNDVAALGIFPALVAIANDTVVSKDKNFIDIILEIVNDRQ